MSEDKKIGNLYIQRYLGESIIIASPHGRLKLTIHEVKGFGESSSVKILFQAEKYLFSIAREEVYDKEAEERLIGKMSG